MNHEDHYRLIERGVPSSGGVWADLGAGGGAYTLALRDAAGSGVEIWAVDRDASALRSLRQGMARMFPGTALREIAADFTGSLPLPPLDGIVAANSIHFVRDRAALLIRWRGYLKPEGRLILVEYDSNQGNRWVPYPVSFASLSRLATATGFEEPELLHVHPSRFNDRIYAALLKPLPNPGADM
jgi:SAM-dependent methyltransferase